MNGGLLKSIIGLFPAVILLIGAIALFSRRKSVSAFLQLIGAGFLVIVIITHMCEALRLLPWMQWGADRSVGHYLDLASAILGLSMFPLGYLLHAVRQPKKSTK